MPNSLLWSQPKELASAEWRIGNLHKFRNRGQPREVYTNFRKKFPGNFRPIWLSSRNFWNFRLNGSLFGNSTISVFSGTFPRKFPYHLSPFRKFRNFWSNGKRPTSCSTRLYRYPWGLLPKVAGVVPHWPELVTLHFRLRHTRHVHCFKFPVEKHAF